MYNRILSVAVTPESESTLNLDIYSKKYFGEDVYMMSLKSW